MIRLKLNLPEATVEYNESGALVGPPVEHTPNQIKNYGIPLEIAGYVSKTDFLAYSLYSSARKFTVAEQISLLTSLGFKTVPYFENENGQGNQLITLKNQYSIYGATWISLPSGKEFAIPEIAHVNAVRWLMSPQHALTMEITTDKGVFEVYDMKLVAYFQPGCIAKVWNGELQPMNTAPITVPTPAYCPKCNNPLKRVQIYPDLPLFYKCTNSICDQMVLDEDQTTPYEPEIDSTTEEFLDEDTAAKAAEIKADIDSIGTDIEQEETPASEEFVVEDELGTTPPVDNPPKCYVDTAKVDAEAVESLVQQNKIVVTEDIEEADFILVKSKLSVSKNVRNLSKEHGLELRPITDYEE